LARRGLGVRDLDECRVREFLRFWGRRHRPHRAQATLRQLLRYLRTTGVLAPAVVSVKRGTAVLIEEQYATYLREERGLVHATLINDLERWSIGSCSIGLVRGRCDSRNWRLAT
jgi:hypothetical protein